jgi:hypothetical protein
VSTRSRLFSRVDWCKKRHADHSNLQLPSTTIRFWSGLPRRQITRAHDWPLQLHLLGARGGHGQGRAQKPSARLCQIEVWQRRAPGWQWSGSPSRQESACSYDDGQKPRSRPKVRLLALFVSSMWASCAHASPNETERGEGRQPVKPRWRIGLQLYLAFL